MSLRCQIMGFDLAAMRALFGSRDGSALKAALDVLESDVGWDEDDEDEVEEAEAVKAVLKRAIFEGAPFPDLDQEDETHATAAAVLSAIGQSRHYTAFSDWKVTRAFPPFRADYVGSLPPREQELLAYLEEGRPLFAPVNASGSIYYAYLTGEEAAALHAALAQLQQEHPELVGEAYLDGFVGSLVAALGEVVERGEDVWYWAS